MTIKPLRSFHQQRIDQFMLHAGQDVPDKPCIPDISIRHLRAKLILEEAYETINALGFELQGGLPHIYQSGEPNIIEIADGCADISVVNTGTLTACGIADEDLLCMIDQSNLAKFGPGGHRREDGKWIKPPDWKAPDILALLVNQGYQP